MQKNPKTTEELQVWLPYNAVQLTYLQEKLKEADTISL